MMSPLRFSIRLKLIFSFFLLLLLIISGFTLFVYYRTSRTIQNEIEKRGIDVTKTFTQMASTYIFESDYITILDNARELVENSDIQSISVMDAKGKIWISTDPRASLVTEMDPFYKEIVRTKKFQKRKIRTHEQWFIECVSPIIALNKVAYLLKVEISLKVIKEQLAESTQNIIMISAGMIVMAVILGIVLSNLLTGPIEQLVQGTNEISRGNLDYRIQMSSNDEIGELARSFNFMTDALQAELSERKQVAEELRRHRNHLEEIVENRTREIQQVVKDLQIEIAEHKATEKKKAKLEAQLQRARKMEAIGTLAGGVAHDLNNILSAIVSYPELLLMKLPVESPLRKPLETIQHSGLRAAAIVQDLLTLARRGLTITEVVNLNAIIKDNLKSPEYKKLMSTHSHIRVETELGKNLMNISGSPVHLSKTLMNLISNAVEAMPDGGELSISTQNRYIDRTINGYENMNEGDYAIVQVSDTGMGIAPTDIERIFEPFFTTKAMGKSGSGLGMAVVWGTVKDHNGYIDVHSKQHRGTTFTLYFPVTRQQPAQDRPQTSIRDLKGKGELILVVDDVAHQREIASAILVELDYRVKTAASGEKALEYLKTQTADLVLLDMIMPPGMDGLETYKQLLRIHPDQKVIIVSGFTETERVKAALKLGAGNYIRKPYMLEKIGSAIRAELARQGEMG